MKLINGAITVLIDRDYTSITVHDRDASCVICEIKLTPEQLSSALSRLSHTPCEIEVYDVSRIGTVMEHQPFTFEMPKSQKFRKKRKTLARLRCVEELGKRNMADWTPDAEFSSASSFFTENGMDYAKTTIRRWVKPA